eukprot:COSAG01_NODE_1414_length_10397_cov_8.813653_2_plen_193_part_00
MALLRRLQTPASESAEGDVPVRFSVAITGQPPCTVMQLLDPVVRQLSSDWTVPAGALSVRDWMNSSASNSNSAVPGWRRRRRLGVAGPESSSDWERLLGLDHARQQVTVSLRSAAAAAAAQGRGGGGGGGGSVDVAEGPAVVTQMGVANRSLLYALLDTPAFSEVRCEYPGDGGMARSVVRAYPTVESLSDR